MCAIMPPVPRPSGDPFNTPLDKMRLIDAKPVHHTYKIPDALRVGHDPRDQDARLRGVEVAHRQAQRVLFDPAASGQAAGIVAKAHEAMAAEKKAAIAELQAEVADLSIAVAGKIIGEKLTAADHAKMIDKFVAEAGSLNGN